MKRALVTLGFLLAAVSLVACGSDSPKNTTTKQDSFSVETGVKTNLSMNLNLNTSDFFQP